VFQCDTELIGFVQRAAGYSLTGSVREQVLFLCHGSWASASET
jgi:putative DNA primase/helicase